MITEEYINIADPNHPDPFDDAFAENLALVLEMLDCMRSESELAERRDEADFLAGIGKALQMLTRIRPGSMGSCTEPPRGDAHRPLRW
ncbi:MAG: hypothetical protein HY287_07330 [Planctomycetes bacterium]|nr:hypothetical protein [Planctomycetota bacterium]